MPIIDVTDLLKPSPIIDSNDRIALLEVASDLIMHLVECDPLDTSSPSYHSDVIDNVLSLLMAQTSDAFPVDASEELEEIVEDAARITFAHFAPRRSYSNTDVKIPPNIDVIRNKIAYLSSVPQAAQRTPEWYQQRHNTLTASSIWMALSSSQSTRNRLIFGKCSPLDTSKYDRHNLESSLHWGQKYEDVSIMWYEREYSTKVSEFGCIPHHEHSFIAASPDGINTDPTSKRFGRMVEVKNIVNRDITGIPKEEYWIQMQLQLEVCQLRECDFLETRFIEYESFEAFFEDGDFSRSSDAKDKGVMALFIDPHGTPSYEYAPIGLHSEIEYNEWNDKVMNNTPGRMWLKNIFWKLDEVSVVLVVRNRRWFNAALPIFQSTWETILMERESGYQHRAPNKRARITMNAPVTLKGCMIDVPSL